MVTLREGDKAPAFRLPNQDDEMVSLSSYKGKKLVLYFYPEDDTPTCTIQACNLRDNYALLKKQGIVVLGVSPDNERSHKKFAAKFHLPFTLIADPDHSIIDKYGVWGQKQMFGREYMGVHRTTFLVDAHGEIKKIFEKPKSSSHADEILAAWKN